jgi:virginiamycin A acetyltransferase
MQKIFKKILLKLIPELKEILNESNNFKLIRNRLIKSKISSKAKIYDPYTIENVELADYSFINYNSQITLTNIGKFCSIGPNFVCGCGIHPTNGISTAPMFYANNRSNGMTFCEESKIEERTLVKIGNDVWIGINVTILDGVTIGDGVIIAAGSVVTKDIPDYAIYGGVPAKLIRFRFNEERILALKKIKWWDFEFDKLSEIKDNFFEIDKFINRNYK